MCKQFMEQIIIREYSKKAKLVGLLLSLALLTMVGWVDYETGNEIDLSVFYLIPIAVLVTTWNKIPGLILALSAAFIQAFIRTTIYHAGMIMAWNITVNVILYSLFVYIFSLMRTALQRESLYARTDSLTGLLNRKAFMEMTSKEFARCRKHNWPITIAYIDCDNFKQLNDQYGHAAGDNALKMIAAIMRQQLRATDLVARFGGDELVVVLAQTEPGAGLKVMQRLRETLITQTESAGLPVTFSIGVASFKVLPETLEEMMERADELMYSVKTAGKNQIKHQVFT